MRNLKKVLSLTLALVMMLGMMTFAGAAEVTKVTSKDMTDMATVENKEAVSLLIDLGIINGVKAADGTYTFNPKGNIERGAYAKMVYAVMMGSDNADVYKGVNTGLKDVKGHWAEGFIGYCVSTKIAAGNGNGTFTPNANITVVAGAKMLLVGLGYDAKLSGYENDPLWSINIMRDAQAAGLLEGIGQAAGDTMTRDTAAQMIFNALFANTVRPDFQMDMGVKYLNGYLPVTKADKVTIITLATRNFNLKTLTGVVVANDFGSVATGTTTQDAGKTVIWNTYSENKLVSTGADDLKIATGVDVLGKEVRYYTYGNKNVDTSFVTATGKTKEYVNNDSDIAFGKFVSNNGLNTSKTTEVVNYAPASYDEADGDGSVLVDSNADGYVDFSMKTTYTFSKVTKVDATNITITGLGTRKLADVSGAAGLVKGDYVSYAPVGSSGKATVAKAVEVAGIVTALKDTKAKAVINGTTYAVAGADVANKAAPADPAKEAYDYIDTLDLSKAVAGIFYLDQAGKIAVYLPTEATTDTTVLYAYVTALNNTISFGKATVEAKVVLADGTQTTVKVVDNATGASSGLYDAAALITDGAFTSLVGKVYPYTLNKDGAMVAGLALDTTDTIKTDNAYVAGSPKMVLTIKGDILMNADTTVLFFKAGTAGAADKINAYKGNDKVPGIVAGTAVTYVKDANKTFATYILVTGVVGEVATAEYAYALGNTYTAQTADGYQYDMVVNGAKVTLTTADVVDTMRIGKIYTYGLDADKIATLAPVAAEDIAGGTVKSVSSKYVVIGSSAIELAADYVVDDLTSVDSKGNIIPGTGALSADTQIIYVTSAGKIVKAYVINAGKAEAADKGVGANKGTQVAVDGYTVNYSGTLAWTLAQNADIGNGATPGNFIAVKFTAPAGISADGSRMKIRTSTNGTTYGVWQDYDAIDAKATTAEFIAGPLSTTGSAPIKANTKLVQVEVNWGAHFSETYTIDISGLELAAAPV